MRSLLNLSLSCCFLSSSAMAAPPHAPDLVNGGNRWTVTAYDDRSAAHNQLATQGICFLDAGVVGTHQRYTWYSDTFPDWNGYASQEGDQVFMHGDYAKDIGHDGMGWSIVSTVEHGTGVGAGHWFEWRGDGYLGNTIGFANTLWKRVGHCQKTESEVGDDLEHDSGPADPITPRKRQPGPPKPPPIPEG